MTPHSAAGLWPCAACGATHYNGCRHKLRTLFFMLEQWRQPLQWVAPHAAQGQRPAAECGVEWSIDTSPREAAIEIHNALKFSHEASIMIEINRLTPVFTCCRRLRGYNQSFIYVPQAYACGYVLPPHTRLYLECVKIQPRSGGSI